MGRATSGLVVKLDKVYIVWCNSTTLNGEKTMMILVLTVALVCASYIMVRAFSQSISDAIISTICFWTIGSVLAIAIIGG